MQYSAVILEYSFTEEWQQDVFEQRLADIGFEMFDGSIAYIPTQELNKQVLSDIILETDGVSLVSISDCEDQDWNATWESEHPIMELPLGISIVPHCAFGAGYHATTSMMIDSLLELQSPPNKVLDNGCGTGVLGIMAARIGAKNITLVDIDEKSIDNAQENIELNKGLLGNATFDLCLANKPPTGGYYNLIMSNLHRNILLQQIPIYSNLLAQGGELWISGFYESDCPVLIEAAAQVGLLLKTQNKREEWIQLALYQPLTEVAE